MRTSHRSLRSLPWLLAVAGSLPLGLVAAARAEGLTETERAIVARVEANRERAIDLLARTIDQPSATENLEGVRAVGRIYAEELEALGFATRWVEMPLEMRKAGHFVAERAGGRGARLLLIGHLDTVLEGERFRREGDRAYGSGTSDMKGGNLVIVEALRALAEAGQLEDRQVIVYFTGDEEETGKPYSVSRADLFEAARRSDAALAFEGWVPGVAVTGRRGFSSWLLEVEGSQGHSSGIFGEERGSGAIFETARILTAFHDELSEPYLTYNPSLILGGTRVEHDPATFSGSASGKTNVVPPRVVVQGDLRFLSVEQRDRARERMRAIAARNLPRTSATLTFLDGMPAMAPTEGNRRLLALLDQVSRDLGGGGVVEHDPLQRGAGDVSFVAGLTPAAIDGLGALGGNEHAPGEWLDLAELPALIERAALLIYRTGSWERATEAPPATAAQ